MGIEIFITVLSGVLSLLAGGIASSNLIQQIFRKVLRLPEEKISYSDRLSKLTGKLNEASAEVDEVLHEIASVADKRQKTVEILEHDLKNLEEKENALKGKIEALENTPIEAAKHFADIISEGEKRGATRDYLLFGAGVVVSTIVGIAIQFFAS